MGNTNKKEDNRKFNIFLGNEEFELGCGFVIAILIVCLTPVEIVRLPVQVSS